ncbi:hypothetical protein BHF68_07170 [Desulfuribacillus alkaliarsenatis]|uniref:Uncharacterized protein n=1 Tax=Desulfuribacillus alkaliarsenatis TaxID=766136 RepID=A0A1E5G1T9_9FIRM|nr:hypothetical protein BHF68_07170 [Desulfuribacillus alkaliarsenatis]
MFNTIVNYYEVIKWMLKDSLFRFRKMSILIIIGEAIGVFLQASAILLAIQYVYMLEKNEYLTMFVISGYPRELIELFIIVCVMVFTLLFVAAMLLYLSGTKMYHLRIHYQKFCSKRVLSNYYDCRFHTNFNREYNESKIMCLTSSDSTFCGRVLRMTLSLIRPLIIFAVSLPIMVYLETRVSVIVIILAFISLLFQYKVSKAAAGYSINVERNAGAASKERRELFNSLSLAPKNINSELVNEYIDKAYGRGSLNKFYSALYGRLLSLEKSSFISNILIAAGIFFILVILIREALLYDKSWTIVVAYIVAVRFTLMSLRQVNRLLTSINRFYPQLKRYYQFIIDTESIPAENKNTERRNYKNESCTDEFMLGNSSNGIIAILSNLQTNYSCYIEVSNLINKDLNKQSTPFIITGYAPWIPAPMYKLFGFKENICNKKILDFFNRLKSNNDSRNHEIYNLFNHISENKWNDIPIEHKFLLSVISAYEDDSDIIVVQIKELYQLSEELREKVLDTLKNKTIILDCGKDLVFFEEISVEKVVIFKNGLIDSIKETTWAKVNKKSLKQWLKQKNDRKNSCEEEFEPDDI